MFLDTSIIIEILIAGKGTESVKKIFGLIRNDQVYISIIQFGELSDWCLRNEIDPAEIIPQIKDITNVLPLGEKIILNGSISKDQRRNAGIEKFSLIDGIILASAMELNEKLLTLDTNFRDLENVILMGE